MIKELFIGKSKFVEYKTHENTSMIRYDDNEECSQYNVGYVIIYGSLLSIFGMDYSNEFIRLDMVK